MAQGTYHELPESIRKATAEQREYGKGKSKSRG